MPGSSALLHSRSLLPPFHVCPERGKQGWAVPGPPEGPRGWLCWWDLGGRCMGRVGGTVHGTCARGNVCSLAGGARVEERPRGILRAGPGPTPAPAPLPHVTTPSRFLCPLPIPGRAGRARTVGGERRSGTGGYPAAGHGPSPRRSGTPRGVLRTAGPPRPAATPLTSSGGRKAKAPQTRGEAGTLRRPRPARPRREEAEAGRAATVSAQRPPGARGRPALRLRTAPPSPGAQVRELAAAGGGEGGGETGRGARRPGSGETRGGGGGGGCGGTGTRGLPGPRPQAAAGGMGEHARG